MRHARTGLLLRKSSARQRRTRVAQSSRIGKPRRRRLLVAFDGDTANRGPASVGLAAAFVVVRDALNDDRGRLERSSPGGYGMSQPGWYASPCRRPGDVEGSMRRSAAGHDHSTQHVTDVRTRRVFASLGDGSASIGWDYPGSTLLEVRILRSEHGFARRGRRPGAAEAQPQPPARRPCTTTSAGRSGTPVCATAVRYFYTVFARHPGGEWVRWGEYELRPGAPAGPPPVSPGRRPSPGAARAAGGGSCSSASPPCPRPRPSPRASRRRPRRRRRGGRARRPGGRGGARGHDLRDQRRDLGQPTPAPRPAPP